MLFLRTAILTIAFLSSLAGPKPLRADNEQKVPDFEEVYSLVRSNLTGLSEADLNRAAVEGFLAKLDSRVRLAESPDSKPQGTNNAATVTGSLYETSFGYIRVNSLSGDSDRAFLNTYQKLSTNKLKGLVIDLRYAGGTDYSDAAAIADLFLPSEQPLLDWGKGMRKSNAKANAITLPVAILVNGRTTGASEALAGMMRQGEIGLLIGSTTSGQASISKEFELKDGSRLLIATTPVKLGSGKPLPGSGLPPDITVEVPGEDENQYYVDAFKVLPRAQRLTSLSTNETSLSLTNRRISRRLSEAELVRMQRDGQSIDFEAAPLLSREPAPSKSGIQDPVLSRALDLLKGLAVVQQFRPSL